MFIVNGLAELSLSSGLNKGKNLLKFGVIVILVFVACFIVALLCHTIIMISGRSDISCLTSNCSDEVINDDGTVTRYLKSACCSISILGECTLGMGTQDKCIIPEIKGHNITAQMCHRKICNGDDTCCSRLLANDICAKGHYTLQGCSLDTHRFLLPDGFVSTCCKYDVECAMTLQTNPLLDLCTRCVKGSCQVGPFDKASGECRLMRKQHAAENAWASSVLGWFQWYREWNDRGAVPLNEKHLYSSDKKKEAPLSWKQWYMRCLDY